MHCHDHDAGRYRKTARSLLLAAAALIASACRQQVPTANGDTQAEASAPEENAVFRARWHALFADPAKVRQAADELGYGVGPYAAAVGSSGGYRMSGVDQVLPNAQLPTHVVAGFSASGPRPTQLDRIHFSFDVVRPTPLPTSKKERDALKTPRRAVQGFLGRFGVGPSDAVKRGLQDFTDATAITTARIVVKVNPLEPGHVRLTVDITPA